MLYIINVGPRYERGILGLFEGPEKIDFQEVDKALSALRDELGPYYGKDYEARLKKAYERLSGQVWDDNKNIDSFEFAQEVENLLLAKFGLVPHQCSYVYLLKEE